MSKKNKKLNKITYVIIMAFTLCFIAMFGVMLTPTPVYAYISKQPDSISKSSNLDFSYDSNKSYLAQSPTGWTKGLPNNNTTSGVINLDNIKDEYNLSNYQKPSILERKDDYVLMLNSKTSQDSYIPAVQYYTNTKSFGLSAYSTYKIKVYTQVTAGARASIYVSGLKDDQSKDVDLSFENIDYNNASEWTTYTFYITTGFETQSVKLELWLGSKPNYASSGAVFFDNIEFVQVSENQIETGTNVKNLVLDKSSYLTSFDSGFDSTSPMDEWTALAPMSNNSYAEILDLSTSGQSLARGITYVGTDYSKIDNYTKNNKNALVLYTKGDNSSYFGFKSKDIELAMYDIVKLTINVKTADLEGNAYIIVKENDVKNSSGNVIESITPATQTITISSNSTNELINNYTTCTFYIKGRSLYNTSYNIELWLGSKENKAKGVVVFDSIKIEDISNENYTNASTGSTSVKMALDSDPSNYIISNSSFNDVIKSNKTLTYPLTPANWTHSTDDERDVCFGVINTNDSIYDAHKSDLGNVDNPGNPKGFGSTSTDTNNILVMQNYNKTYQTATSSKFSMDKESYYKLSFDYKIIETNLDSKLFNVYLIDEDGNVLYANENLSTTYTWKSYSIYINTKEYSSTLSLVLSLGTNDNLVQGLAYIDNVILVKDTKMTQDKYEEIAITSNVLDFEQGNFNLVKKDDDIIYTPLRYTESLENTTTNSSGLKNGFGGIIDADNTANNIEKFPNSSSALPYLMMLKTIDKATYSMTAKDSLSLSSDTYHKFTIDIKTKKLQSGLDYDKTYGAVFALSGLSEKIDGIISEDWQTYTIYVACTSSVDINVKFAIESLDMDTCGIAYFDNFTYSAIEKDDYNLAKVNMVDDGTTLFIGNTDVDADDNDNNSTTNLDYIWYLIPTLILAIALIVALIAYVMKKVKIKKWEKRKINEYDRDKTLHRDVIRKDAEKTRDANVKELKDNISELEKQKQHIEEIHQEQLKANRTTRAKGITASSEREFKQYAKMHTALENRIANLNKQIEKMNTAEYLLSIQHKIILEKAKKDRLAKEKAYADSKKKKDIKK